MNKTSGNVVTTIYDTNHNILDKSNGEYIIEK